jgi:hypothetical protein
LVGLFGWLHQPNKLINILGIGSYFIKQYGKKRAHKARQEILVGWRLAASRLLTLKKTSAIIKASTCMHLFQ